MQFLHFLLSICILHLILYVFWCCFNLRCFSFSGRGSGGPIALARRKHAAHTCSNRLVPRVAKLLSACLFLSSCLSCSSLSLSPLLAFSPLSFFFCNLLSLGDLKRIKEKPLTPLEFVSRERRGGTRGAAGPVRERAEGGNKSCSYLPSSSLSGGMVAQTSDSQSCSPYAILSLIEWFA